MKTYLFAAALFTLGCGLSGFAAESYVRESSWAGETFTSKVIKDLSFHDDGADYIAYLVRWRDHEVVVTAPGPVEKRYAVGDSIRCQMMRQEITHGAGKQNRLTFMVSVAPSNHETARHKAIADEVARRRELRENAAAEIPAKPKS
jgi:hypothetical protein